MCVNFRTTTVLALELMLTACGLAPRLPGQTAAPASAPGGTAAPLAPAELAPTETPVPIVRVGSGDRSLFNGDYEAAVQEYRAAADSTDDPGIRAAAYWGLARAQYSDRRYDAAIVALQQLTSEYPESSYAAASRFLEGECLEALGRHSEAASAYADYIIARPGVLDSFVSAAAWQLPHPGRRLLRRPGRVFVCPGRSSPG